MPNPRSFFQYIHIYRYIDIYRYIYIYCKYLLTAPVLYIDMCTGQATVRILAGCSSFIYLYVYRVGDSADISRLLQFYIFICVPGRRQCGYQPTAAVLCDKNWCSLLGRDGLLLQHEIDYKNIISPKYFPALLHAVVYCIYIKYQML